MADISITAANVAAGSTASTRRGTAGATITAGQVVYLDAADSRYKLADCDSATVAARSPVGLALHGASSGQPLEIAYAGPVTIGGTLTSGVVYYCSPNAGGIAPVADLGSGDYVSILGIATSTSILKLAITESGVAL